MTTTSRVDAEEYIDRDTLINRCEKVAIIVVKLIHPSWKLVAKYISTTDGVAVSVMDDGELKLIAVFNVSYLMHVYDVYKDSGIV